MNWMLWGAMLLAGVGSALWLTGSLEPTPPPPPKPSGKEISVLISYKLDGSGFAQKYIFPSLELIPNQALTLKAGPSREQISLALTAPPNEPLVFAVEQSQLVLQQGSASRPLGAVVRLEAAFAETAPDLRLRIASTQRPSPPEYPGALWLSVLNGGVLAVNSVDFQEYLRRVVPSEMPPRFEAEALKAQAVAARTYAYARQQAPPERNFWKQYFADVDDTVSEQVYNQLPTHPATDQAVYATHNQILTYQNQPIQTYFFSTSPGHTASIQEVWPEQNPIAYLVGQPQTPEAFSLGSEAEALAFFRNWQPEKFWDGASPYFRWKLRLSKAELEAILSQTLPQTARTAPRFVQTPEGAFSPEAPGFSLGELQGLEVTRRSSGGFASELEIRTSTGRYLVGRESNIRNLFRPNPRFTGGTPVSLERLGAEPLSNPNALPSAAFALEAEPDGPQLKAFTFWGGGFGHGVGMSQFGANGLAQQGQSYPQILAHFYPQTRLQTFP